MNDTRIEAKGIGKHFGADRQVLDSVSFAVRAGEIYCLVGAPGSGKSTLIATFLSLVRPSWGQALLDGVDCAERPLVARRSAAFVTPRSVFYSFVSARRNVEFFARMAGAPHVDRTSVENAMRAAGIPERHFDRTAGGLRRDDAVKLWLAIARLREVRALVLDEPLTGLDWRPSGDIRELLMDCRNAGTAVLMTTSDIGLAAEIADRTGLLTSGRIGVEHSRLELSGPGLSQFYMELAGRPRGTVESPWSNAGRDGR